MINQLCSLERNVSRGGQETIAPPKDRRDDVINAAAGALVNVGYESAPRIMRYEDFLRGGEVANQDNLHYTATIAAFNQWLREFTTGQYTNIMPQQYPGVSIVMGNGKITAQRLTY